jgi:hypothetical protein
MTEDEVARRMEFEQARLDRLLDKSNRAVWQGKWIEAATFIAEAKRVRAELDELEALY